MGSRPSVRARLTARWWLFRQRIVNSDRPAVARVGQALYAVPRWLQGARRVACGSTALPGFGTAGTVVDSGIEIAFSGACPVQGEGTVDGREVYYRSRGEGWQFHVAKASSEDPLDDEAWVYSERPYFHPDGGWVSAAVSVACIDRAIAKWREVGRP